MSLSASIFITGIVTRCPLWMRLVYTPNSIWSANLWCHGSAGKYEKLITNPGEVADEICAGIQCNIL